MKGKTTIMDTTGIILAGGKSSRFGFNKLKIRNNGVPLFIDQVFKLGFFCDEIIISASKKNQSFISSELNKISIYEKRYDFKKMQASNPEINFRFFFKRMAKAPGIKVILDEEIYNNTGISNISKTFGNRRPGKLCGGIGPILGIYLGLAGSSCHYSLVTASDMPFVSYNLLKLLSKAPTVSNEMQDSSKKDRLPFSVSGGKPAYIIKTGKGFETLCGLYSKYCLGTFKNNIIGQRYKILDALMPVDIEIIPDTVLMTYGIDNLNFFNINHRADYYEFRDIWQRKKKLPGINLTFPEKWSSFFFRKPGFQKIG